MSKHNLYASHARLLYLIDMQCIYKNLAKKCRTIIRFKLLYISYNLLFKDWITSVNQKTQHLYPAYPVKSIPTPALYPAPPRKYNLTYSKLIRKTSTTNSRKNKITVTAYRFIWYHYTGKIHSTTGKLRLTGNKFRTGYIRTRTFPCILVQQQQPQEQHLHYNWHTGKHNLLSINVYFNSTIYTLKVKIIFNTSKHSLFAFQTCTLQLTNTQHNHKNLTKFCKTKLRTLKPPFNF